jgi:hypothetical protein
MTTEQLTGRELDAYIAEHIMGWKWATLNPRIYPTLVGKRFLVEPNSRDALERACGTDVPLDELWYGSIPPYSSDMNAAMQMQERIKELGLHQQYAAVLMKITHNPIMSYVDPFNAIHASAAERVRAAVKCLEGKL